MSARVTGAALSSATATSAVVVVRAGSSLASLTRRLRGAMAWVCECVKGVAYASLAIASARRHAAALASERADADLAGNARASLLGGRCVREMLSLWTANRDQINV